MGDCETRALRTRSTTPGIPPHTNTHTRMCANIARMHACTPARTQYAHVPVHTCPYARIYACMNVRMCACSCTPHTHVPCIHTCTQGHSRDACIATTPQKISILVCHWRTGFPQLSSAIFFDNHSIKDSYINFPTTHFHNYSLPQFMSNREIAITHAANNIPTYFYK